MLQIYVVGFCDNSDATGMTNDTGTVQKHEHSGLSDYKNCFGECITLIVSNKQSQTCAYHVNLCLCSYMPASLLSERSCKGYAGVRDARICIQG